MSNAWSVMAAPAHLEFTRSIVLRDRVHLLAELLAVLDAGGEGLMIQQPENPYTAGRTRRMLKVKRQSLHFLPRAKGASASRGSAESRA
jgi:ATP-dependent DNA ligase